MFLVNGSPSVQCPYDGGTVHPSSPLPPPGALASPTAPPPFQLFPCALAMLNLGELTQQQGFKLDPMNWPADAKFGGGTATFQPLNKLSFKFVTLHRSYRTCFFFFNCVPYCKDTLGHNVFRENRENSSDDLRTQDIGKFLLEANRH